jgi:S1-C subfamily serine protease
MDIALLIKKAIPFDQITPVLNYPVGNINDLQWGSLVYIMGYPLGNLMVTRAIVSVTNKMKTGIFVTDALYNHGISGSPVFAIRDGLPNFELIGMASSAAAQKLNILVTSDDFKAQNNLKTPYEGNIFVDNSKLISYGVTYSVSIDEIVNFVRLNEQAILDAGFDINKFFK